MTTSTKSGAGVSRYLRLYRVLSQALAEGRYARGRQLPSEPQLMREYGVARSTVRRALGRLEAERRIERKRGRGTFAREGGLPVAAPVDLSSVLDATERASPDVTWRTLAFQRIATPGFLALRPGGFGATAVIIRQTRSIAGEVIVLDTTYVPQEVGGNLSGRDLGRSGAGAPLTALAHLGHASATLEREYAALAADPLAADTLRVAVGTPLLNVRTAARDAAGRVVAYINSLYRSDRYEAHPTLFAQPSMPHVTRSGAPRPVPIRPSSRDILLETPSATLATRRVDQGVARYYRLYELLAAALQDGTLPSEGALPSEPELCARFQLSRTTVRRALARLEGEGRIVRRRGSGTYAKPMRTTSRLCVALDALPAALAQLESLTTSVVLRFDPAPLPRALAAIAGEIGSPTYLLERLRCRRREPLSLTATYLPAQVAGRLRKPIPRQPSLMTLLDKLGLPAVPARCSVAAIASDIDAAQALQVPLGAPLLRVRAVLTGDAGGVHAVLECRCRSDRLQLSLLEIVSD